MADLFTELTIRGVSLRNRIGVSPMCQYVADEGRANDWHFVHYGSRAVGGAGLIIVEATAVAPEGRITPWDLGLWDDGQIGPLKRITEFLRDQGSVPAIQLGHAGRKAGRSQTWLGNWRVEVSQGGWERIVAPSPVSYYPLDGAPEELTEAEISKFTDAFAGAAVRAVEAGFGIMEIHGAHGYLIHEFLSPLSNKRTDRYGGTFENRIRFLMEVIHAVRKVIPDSMPLLVRISATDWMPDEESWEPDQAVELARRMKSAGVDLVDCSSGGLVPEQKIHPVPGYQTGFSERIRREAGVLTGTVGMITDPLHARQIIQAGQADLVLIGREFLRDPYFPLHAAGRLGLDSSWPDPYHKAK